MRLRFYSIMSAVLLAAFCVSATAAPTVGARFVTSIDGSIFTAKVQLIGSEAFDIGNSSLRFTFNAAGLELVNAVGVGNQLNAADLTWHNFQGFIPAATLYQSTVTLSKENEISVNIVLASTGAGQTVPTEWIDAISIKMKIKSKTELSSLLWTLKEVFLEDNETLVAPGEFADDRTLLPVELASFTAHPEAGAVLLRWETASERNNAGFEVERSITGERFESIGYVDGAGTTLTPMNYSFRDEVTMPNVPKLFYRLRQIDFDGASTFSPVVEVSAPVPREFKVEGAYPNPFNGRTVIGYQLPDQQQVRLTVYDALGRQVKMLVDQNQPAGHYAVPFDAAGMPSGLYIFRIEAGQYVDAGRILYVK